MNESISNISFSNNYIISLSSKRVSDKVYTLLKRLFDIVIASFAIIFLFILTIIIKIISIISKDTKSIFYAQKRVGKNVEIFKIYKFRTMVPDADKKLVELLKKDKKAKKEWETHQKISNDPRITKLGRIIRKTSIDEVPQFINVLKGDMSIIGPRPLVIGELDKFNGNHDIYERVKPGITGWWACNGRSEISYDERLKLEYFYIANRSILLDIKCIMKQ